MKNGSLQAEIQGQKDHLGVLPGKSGKEKRNQT